MSHFGQNSAIRLLMHEWANGLAESIEMMLGQRPQVHWKETGPFAQTEPMLWWRQSLSLGPDYMICAGSTSAEALSMGRFIFAAAGTEEIEDSEAKNTYLEVLSQSIAVLTRALASELTREISVQNSQESEQPSGEFLATFELTANGQRLGPIHAAFSEKLLELLTAPAAPIRPELHADMAMDETALASRSLPYVLRSKTMDLLLEVELPVSISFGRAKIPLRDAIKLTTGSIVELNRALTDPVEVIVNNCVIARGEVVVVDGNYGVRIQQIITREERLRTLR